MPKAIFTIKQLLESGLCPVRRTRLITLIKNGIKFDKGQLPKGENYIIAWKSGDGKKSPWMIDSEEVYAWKERAKNRKF